MLPNSLVYLLDTGDREEEEEEKGGNEDEFDFDDCIEMTVNDDLTIIILKPMRG